MVLVDPEAEIESGLVELQVSGIPVNFIPRMSVTVACSVVVVLVFTTNEVARVPGALTTMDWTGQVSNRTGWERKVSAMAKKGVMPGRFAEAISWFKGAPTGGELRLTAPAICPVNCTLCQET